MKYGLKELELKLKHYLDSKFNDGVDIVCRFVENKPMIKIWASHFISRTDGRHLKDNRDIEIYVHVDNLDYLKIRKAIFSLLS